jgi:hypothetical protein
LKKLSEVAEALDCRLVLDYKNGQTPLDEDEKEGLLINTVTKRGEQRKNCLILLYFYKII